MDELSKSFPIAFHTTKSTRAFLPKQGPIIVSEFDKLPWRPPEFRRWRRMVADVAGVPKDDKNRDSRKGE